MQVQQAEEKKLADKKEKEEKEKQSKKPAETVTVPAMTNGMGCTVLIMCM